jgi:hypothetical protein
MDCLVLLEFISTCLTRSLFPIRPGDVWRTAAEHVVVVQPHNALTHAHNAPTGWRQLTAIGLLGHGRGGAHFVLQMSQCTAT